MAALSEVCAGFEAVLGSISSARAYSEEPDEITTNDERKVVIWPQFVETQQDTFGGRDVSTFHVIVLGPPYAPGGGHSRGLQALQPYMSPAGPDSIRATLHADRDLGGAAHELACGRVFDLGPHEKNGVARWGVIVECQVWH